MPIRFRCSQCDRLLGIARRKAGQRIRCPQCGEHVTVPPDVPSEPAPADRTLQDLDDLLGPAPVVNGTLVAPPQPAVATLPASRPLPIPRPAAPKPPKPKKAPNPDSLFEQDVDALLGLEPEEAIPLDDGPKAKPVNGMDAMSLDEGSGSITLSSQKATLLVVAAVILMVIAFVVGFAIRATI